MCKFHQQKLEKNQLTTHTLSNDRALHWVPMPTHAYGFWVGMGVIKLFMGGHGCDMIGHIIDHVTIFEYMGAI